MTRATLTTITLTLAACRTDPDCLRDTKAKAWHKVLVSCAAVPAAARTDDEVLALARANLYAHPGNPKEAARLAKPLLAGPRSADAHLLVGLAAADLHEFDQAVVELTAALAGHQAAGNDAASSRAGYALAGALQSRGQLRPALEALRTADAAARRAGDRRMQVYTERGLADLLRQAGAYVEAEVVLTRALSAAGPEDRPWILLKQGILFLTVHLPQLALSPLQEAERLERRSASPDPQLLMAAALNLAMAARVTGRWEEALAHVADAERAGATPFDIHLNRGLALAEGGRLEEALADLVAAEADGPTGQWEWWTAYHRGRVEERLGRREAALSSYPRAADAVTRFQQEAGELGPQLLATHREPYLHLFGLHAAAGRWAEALEVVAQLQAHRLMASQASPADLAFTDGPRPVPDARLPVRPPPAAAALLAAWRGRHLVVALSDGERLWRLEVEGGAVKGTPVGPAAALEAQAAALEADPSRAAEAEALGVALVPPGAGPAPLELLLVGPIARTPLAALRRDGQLLLARTPLVRVLGLVPVEAREPGRGPPAVLGDPRDDLPAARLEALDVARTLRVQPSLGRDVTREALLAAAASASVLHLAAHGEDGPDGPQVLLAGGALTAADVAALPRVPGLVVLGTCGAAAARNDAGWGSLAAAFLEAGARHVVASPWAVDDASALELARAFHARGGAAEPARALAAAQLELSARLPAREWAGFTVLAAPPPAPRPAAAASPAAR